jgi:VIT1/CCC1 family predicted Fe2+/Mn2+ transporter
MTEQEGWDQHYRDEVDAAYLYRTLATFEPDIGRRDLFSRLADVEDRHVSRWRELFANGRRPLPAHRPSGRTRLLAWLGRRFGSRLVMPLILAEEGREVQGYMGLARQAADLPVRRAAAGIAVDSAVHARELADALGRPAEPWHLASAGGGYLRSIVYGFNDGLTANFGLVAGVIGANVDPTIVIITGVAGAIADALSMGASGYLAAKSEAEVQAHQIEMERRELQLMPDLEREELTLLYEAKGFSRKRAEETAHEMMRDPEQALEAQVREELHITESSLTPAVDGWVTGTATALGAFIPIVPFLLLPSELGMWISLVVSMLAHFAVGAARSFFTGRSVWASGRDMFAVGFGVALVGYVIGELITRVI